MHLNTYQSFLKVQCHLLCGKREMKACLSSDRSMFGCTVPKRGEGCVCVCMCVGAGRHVWSIISVNPWVAPAVTFHVALHWPLVYRQKLTHTLRGGRECRWQGGEKGMNVVKSRGGGNYIFIIHFQRDLLLFLLCSASVSVAKTSHHDYSPSVRGDLNAVPATSQRHPSEQQ